MNVLPQRKRAVIVIGTSLNERVFSDVYSLLVEKVVAETCRKIHNLGQGQISEIAQSAFAISNVPFSGRFLVVPFSGPSSTDRRCSPGRRSSGESEIRCWIIENDWLEAIVGLPEQLFDNTGIATYIWVVTNRKPPRRKGKVQLIDATNLFVKQNDARRFSGPSASSFRADRDCQPAGP